MEKLFKKFLYTGVGMVATTADHLQKQINETVEKTNQSEVEGKRIVEDLVSDIKSQTKEYDGKFKNIIDKVLSRFELPTKEEVENLHTKIAALEAQLDVTEEVEIEVIEVIEEATEELELEQVV
jgi:polyhydroxyalkanoate synthesis regulator phasin